MKQLIKTILISWMLVFSSHLHGQTVLSIGESGVIGLPDTVSYGDTIQGMSVFLVNESSLPISGLLVDIIADPNLAGNPLPIGSINIPVTSPIGPGDSIGVPLNMFIVTPQNSNNGSNVMVVWPASPGTTPKDTAQEPYYVDDVVSVWEADNVKNTISVYPNPTKGTIWFTTEGGSNSVRRILVYRLDGVLIGEYKGLPGSIELPIVAPGILIIRIEGKNGEVTSRRILRIQ